MRVPITLFHRTSRENGQRLARENVAHAQRDLSFLESDVLDATGVRMRGVLVSEEINEPHALALGESLVKVRIRIDRGGLEQWRLLWEEAFAAWLVPANEIEEVACVDVLLPESSPLEAAQIASAVLVPTKREILAPPSFNDQTLRILRKHLDPNTEAEWVVGAHHVVMSMKARADCEPRRSEQLDAASALDDLRGSFEKCAKNFETLPTSARAEILGDKLELNFLESEHISTIQRLLNGASDRLRSAARRPRGAPQKVDRDRDLAALRNLYKSSSSQKQRGGFDRFIQAFRAAVSEQYNLQLDLPDQPKGAKK